MTMSSLKDVRILLTGGTGFLGRHLMPALQDAGAVVMDVSRRVGYDLRNEAETLTAMLLARPSIVIHLAAPPSYYSPGTAYRDTVLMGMNVANAAAIQNASQGRVKLVMIGHPACYPTLADHPEADEEAFWNGAPQTSTPDGAMGAAKKSLLQACEAYQVQYGLGYSYLIPDFMYGPYENRSLVAVFVTAIMEAQALKRKSCDMPVALAAEGRPESPLYVADAVKAITQACIQDPVGGPINLPGYAPGLDVKDIAKTVAEALKYSGKLVWAKAPKMPYPPFRPLKAGRAGKDFQWAAETSLEQGIQEYVDWCWRSIPQPQAAT